MCQEGKERNVECESKGTEQQSQGARRPLRAAAKDGQCKSQLRLDLSLEGGNVGKMHARYKACERGYVVIFSYFHSF